MNKNKYFRYKWKAVLAVVLALNCFSAPVTQCFAAQESAPPATSGEAPAQGQGGAEGGEEQTDIPWPQGPGIMAEAGVVMEASTGTILYEKNMDTQHYPASITKLMTVLLALENCLPDEMVTVPHEAVYMEDKGSHVALDEGERLTVEQCLYASLLASANDATYALAIHVGGTIENFIEMMNSRAKELGCKNTSFNNPHGLPDTRHLTTAYDMALIVREVLNYDLFRNIEGARTFEIPATEFQKDNIPMEQHHKMLMPGKYHYEGAFAGKTGYTTAALNTLVTCAERDGMELICVTMKTQGKQVYADTASLLDFGFDNFKKVNISQNETGYGEVPLQGEEGRILTSMDTGCCVVIPKEAEFRNLSAQFVYEGTGDGSQSVAGYLNYTLSGREVGTAALNILSVERPQPADDAGEEKGQERQAAKKGSFKWWYIPLVLLCVLLAGGGVYFALLYRKILEARRRKNRRRRNVDRHYTERTRQFEEPEPD